MQRLSDYEFELPERLIAQTPLDDRSASRLMVVKRSENSIQHKKFSDLPELLAAGDLIVLNNTKVTARRLFGTKETGGQVELLILGLHLPPNQFRALTRPAKRLRVGTKILLQYGITAVVTEELEEGLRIVEMSAVDEFDKLGEIPLPPYIHERLSQESRYQTVYSKESGSSAAPTAGLHFTPELLQTLSQQEIEQAEVTLSVGIDTFRPVSTETITDHKMHGELCEISAQTAEKINGTSGRIVAVGTTVTRTLESFATDSGELLCGRKNTDIFIFPGYEFKVVDAMLTNFHLPKTSMLMMISAFANRDLILHAYAEAVQHEYRFLSFGDAMMIL